MTVSHPAERVAHPPGEVHPREHGDGAPLLGHIPALDGLRGAAVAGVLLFHANLLVGGYLGVDLFFGLSGFLITSLLLAERRETGRIDLRRFWARRARRLLPALAGLLAGVVVFAVVFADSNQLGQIRSDAIATMAYVANWHAILAHTGYWEQFVAPSPLEHMWSLAIEEQFYVIWPFVAYAVLRRHRRADGSVRHGARDLLVVSAVMALASLALMVHLASPAAIERVYLGTDTRASSMLIGAALACWLAWRGPVRSAGARVAVELAGWIGLAVLVVAWTSVEGTTIGLYRGGLFVCGLAVAAVIAAVTHPRSGPLAAVLAVAPLRFLGMISYGLYLWHWPIFLVLDQSRLGFGGWPLFTVQVAVSLGFALMSYYTLELPIRQGRWQGSMRLAVPVTAVTLVGALLGATAGATSPPALADTVTAVRASLDQVVPPPAEPSASLPPRILFVGDSVSYFLAQEFLVHQADFGVVAASAALPGCRFTPGRVRLPGGKVVEDGQWPMCDTLWTEAVDRVRPDVVFLTVADPGAIDREVDRRWTNPCDAGFDAYLQGKLRNAVDMLSATGARVVLGTSVRALPSYANGSNPDHLDCFNRSIAAVVAADARLRMVDVDGFVCPGGTCTEQADGHTLRLDGLHFVGPAADYVDGWLIPKLTALVDR